MFCSSMSGLYFYLDFIAYNQIVKTVVKYRNTYKQLWESIGELDAAIAVAYYRKYLSFYTVPTFVDTEELEFKNLAHPLLKDPVTNSSALGKTVLLTGSNASGKSTYIKAVAINAILAQTINTVLASKWTMKQSYIVTSMAIQDSVLDGDSYFIAEIKSLKRIIKLSEEQKPIISFIDEILKGTNTVERISASAAIMEWLSVNKGMTIIASHDIELTEITGELYTNYHFRESIVDGKVIFDYKIHPGPSETRNAIKLLEVLDYPESVTITANKLARHFTNVREWQRMDEDGSINLIQAGL
ncbi:AAA family ATPase [Sporosarcina thermotolerans]|uniref:MutS-related protein n=1 Tax=Sporosarcina thermotolerans TaxID=633404 RepID=UPI0024BD109B|nr:AAA family ATPase [Sporosarcina thermotolerans]WHT48625.1 AAA family ATPase [Sporosarcina thermotolerans]